MFIPNYRITFLASGTDSCPVIPLAVASYRQQSTVIIIIIIIVVVVVVVY
jgi:hypothetical protein